MKSPATPTPSAKDIERKLKVTFTTRQQTWSDLCLVCGGEEEVPGSLRPGEAGREGEEGQGGEGQESHPAAHQS